MANKKTKQSTRRFVGGLVIYALAFFVVTLAGWGLLLRYISAYEQSRPNHVMEDYVSSFDKAHIRAVSADFIASLDPALKSEDEDLTVIEEALDGTLSYARKSKESTQNRSVYVISLDGHELGNAVLAKGEEGDFGFSPWQVEEERFDFSYLLREDEITVPEGWSVAVNGTELGARYIQEEQIPFESLKNLYSKLEQELPCLRTYHVDHYIGEIEFVVRNSSGREVPITDDMDEALFLANCTETEQSELSAFIEEFLPYYIRCLTNSNHGAEFNYIKIKPYLLAGGDLDSRLYQSLDSQQHTQGGENSIESLDYNMFMRLDESSYLVDFSYELDMLGHNGHVTSDNNARLLLVQTADGLKASAIFSY